MGNDAPRRDHEFHMNQCTSKACWFPILGFLYRGIYMLGPRVGPSSFFFGLGSLRSPFRTKKGTLLLGLV